MSEPGTAALTGTEIRSVCVFCGSAAGDDPSFAEAGRKLGRLLAERRLTLIYGGGHVGIMGAVAEGALNAGGHVIGVIPEFLTLREAAYLELPELEIVDSMHQRKNRMSALSDAFVTLPGGFGTLEETFEVLTWRQLGLHDKPIVLANLDNFWTPLMGLIDNIIGRAFAREENRRLLDVVQRIDDVLPALERAADAQAKVG